MDSQKSEEPMSRSSRDLVVTTSARVDNIHSRRRIIQNFLLIWLDADINQTNKDHQIILTQLQSVVNDVHTFTRCDECVEFLTAVDDRKAFIIVADTMGQQMVPIIYDIPHLDSIYIFSRNKARHEDWGKHSSKIKGVYTDITSICQALKEAIKRRNQDDISVSFVNVNQECLSQNLNELEPSFMYTQIFKEILIQIERNELTMKDFTQFWRNENKKNANIVNSVDDFERDYCPKSSIQWYTREAFLYQTLNLSLRTLESEIIMKMSFFIYDLHCQIKELHRQQLRASPGRPLIVYRGQGLSTADFEKLQKTKGGLISFNNFLSTSEDRELSLAFAESASVVPDQIGVIFEMCIVSTIASTPFAFIQEVSDFKSEQEILFSMHTVFRIGTTKQTVNNSRLWEVQLTLTDDNDPKLTALTQHIREEIDGTGWHQMGQLLLKIGQFDKAEELYTALLAQTSDDSGRAHIYNMFGIVKTKQGQYKEALCFCEKALDIARKTLPEDDPSLAHTYNTIGEVYHAMGDHPKALEFLEKACQMKETALPLNHPRLATSYNNIGLVYNSMGDYPKALEFYEKTHQIFEKALPSNHPNLATSSNNIGLVYNSMGDYTKALEFYEKGLEIEKKVLPSNHPDLATSYDNISAVFNVMGNYSKAIEFYEEALRIRVKALPPNHPDLAYSYGHIGSSYNSMGNYSQALEFYEKAFKISEEAFPPNHPSLAGSCNNIGGVYKDMGEYSKALEFYEKAHQMKENVLPPNHLDLATSYNNIGLVYNSMGDYSRALEFYDKAHRIFEKALLSNHPSLAGFYNNLGAVYNAMGDYSRALEFYGKAHRIFEKALSPDHSNLATLYNNIGEVHRVVGDYSKALEFLEKAHNIKEKVLPPNHLDLATSYNNIGLVYNSMGDYSKALEFYEKTHQIFEKVLPLNHPSFADCYNNIGAVYNAIGDYSKALEFYVKALQIREKALSANHPHLANSYHNISVVYYDTGDYLKALEFSEKALAILQNSVPPTHPYIEMVKNRIDRAKKKAENMFFSSLA